MSNFTASEIDIILEALDSWEREPTYQAIGKLTMYALSGMDAERAQEQVTTDNDQATYHAGQRKRLSLKLRIKLYDALDEAAERQDEAAKRAFDEVTANQEAGAK